MELPIMEQGEMQRPIAEISEASPTEVLIPWIMQRFAHQRIVITTQFGMEGCALIDMCARHTTKLKVAYLDTMFFFRETYELRDRLAARYPHVLFVNRGTDLTPEQQAEQYGPELWKRDPDLCCKLRKTDPMTAVMGEVDVWITGLRRSQSATRASLRVIEWDWRYKVLKVNPLAASSRRQIWQYIKANDVPYNVLHERGYPSVGCTHCTSRVEGASPEDYTRSGRWSGMEKTECGLHGDGI